MTKQEWSVTGIFILSHCLLTVPFALWPGRDLLLDTLTFALYSLLAAGLAAELTELILGLVWPRYKPPQISGPVDRTRTAILMTVCDDWSIDKIAKLKNLATTGYDVYLLDDSSITVSLPKDLQSFITPVIRKEKKGAKAGNLNHWITNFGSGYEFAVILDADSTMSASITDTLVLSAHQHQNQDVAVFQSKIESEPSGGSLFAETLSAGARPRARIFERVHAPLNLLLSFGHNQLVRLSAVKAVGGFNESFSAEDTALSLDLAAADWRIELVDVWSYDTDPDTILKYNRRTIRWARQTVELFHQNWYHAPLRLKVLLCRHLLSYLLPFIGILLLGISLWLGPKEPNAVWAFLKSTFSFTPGYVFYGISISVVISSYLLVLILRITIARLESVSWRKIFLSSLFGGAVHLMLVIPMTLSMLATALGRQVRFVPTNSRLANRCAKSRFQLIGRILCAGALVLLLTFGALMHPGSLLVGFNSIWLGALILSPIILIIFSPIYRIRSQNENKE